MKIGISVVCRVCDRVKKPHGRSAPLERRFCESLCPGYEHDPKPGCLWPGETEEDFGYPVCYHATVDKEVTRCLTS